MKEIKTEKIKKIVFFLHMGIGDLIAFIPTIRAFKKYFHKATISIAAKQKYQPLLQDMIDEFIPFRGRDASFKEKVLFVRKMRRKRFDMIVKPALGSTYSTISLLGIPHRLGHSLVPWSFILNYPAAVNKDKHMIDNNLHLFYSIGGKKAAHDFSIKLYDYEHEKTREIFRKRNIRKENLIIGMGIGTSVPWKEWGVDKFSELADRLIEDKKAKIVLLGDSKTLEKGKIMEAKMSHLPINLIGTTTIREAASIIKKCKLFVSNDGGLMWLSAAVGTPVVAIFGPTDYKRVMPPGKKHAIVRKNLPCSPCYKSPHDYSKPTSCEHRKCLEESSVADVIATVKRIVGY